MCLWRTVDTKRKWLPLQLLLFFNWWVCKSVPVGCWLLACIDETFRISTLHHYMHAARFSVCKCQTQIALSQHQLLLFIISRGWKEEEEEKESTNCTLICWSENISFANICIQFRHRLMFLSIKCYSLSDCKFGEYTLALQLIFCV